nr:reverse transcriptase domain-containing protein [Tanacetum cinerariifolium]
MTDAQAHHTTTKKELLAVVYAFEKLCPYLVLSKSILYMDHSALKYSFNKQDAKPRLLCWVLLLQEFDITVRDKRGAENLATDHLSRLENPHQSVLDKKDINETFPLDTLNMCVHGQEAIDILKACQNGPAGDIMARTTLPKRCLTLDFIVPQSIVKPMTWSNLVTLVNVRERFHNEMKRLKIPSKFTKFSTFGASISWGRSRLHERTTFKTPIGCTPYKLVYRKACHLPIELEHKAYWALKHCNYDLQTTGDHQKVQLNVLNELRDQAYENSLIYKEKSMRLHDLKIKDRVFNVSDRVILFNSRLNIFSGKLKTRLFGPFTIIQEFPYGTVELSQTDEPNFKVNGYRLKHYFREDIPKMVVPDLQTFFKDQ